MLNVEELDPRHRDEAQALAVAAYDEACSHLPALPPDAVVPAPGSVAEDGMGVAAFDGRRMVGFLAGVAPFDGLFGPTRGTCAPLGAFVVTGDRRSLVATLLYEAAAARWVEAGALSHAVVAYAHDVDALEGLARSGFGRRAVDAIRPVRALDPAPSVASDVMFTQVPADRRDEALPLYRGMWAHLGAAPTFLVPPETTDKALLDGITRRGSRVFVARAGQRLVAFLEVTADGETFVDAVPSAAHVCAAYVVPDHRGRGVAAGLLDHVLATLADEGSTHLGVDYEEFNPAARGFWRKHFVPFTRGVTRRLDERLFAPAS